MYWREICYLYKEQIALDSLRKPQKSFIKRKIFCDEQGIKRNEFYQAKAQGYKPELCLVIKKTEFNNESHIEYNEIMYRIIRAYPVKNECLELICTSLVVGNE